jgi:folate-dependent phosphoribosylglycinamide formyltransferase PurN
MLIRRLVQLGMPPALVLYHQKAEVSGKDRIIKPLKASIKSILFRGSISERIRRVRLSYERDAKFLLDDYAQRNGLSWEMSGLNVVHHISQVNHADTAELLKSQDIDVLFIWGIPIIRPNIIGSVKMMVINAHSSILPEYRGAKSEFWQCFNQDFKHAGITLHQVDVGVDTGDILMQVKANPADCINPERLRVSNAIRVIEGLPILLETVKSGSYRRILQSDLSKPKTPTYRVKDVGIEHLSKVYLGIDSQTTS